MLSLSVNLKLQAPPPDATRPGMLPGLIERNTDSTAWLKAY